MTTINTLIIKFHRSLNTYFIRNNCGTFSSIPLNITLQIVFFPLFNATSTEKGSLLLDLNFLRSFATSRGSGLDVGRFAEKDAIC